MSTPTLRELKNQYLEAATIEKLRRNKPSDNTVRNTLSGLRVFCSWLKTDAPDLGEPADLAVDALITPKLLRRYVTSLLARGIRPISALSFVSQLRQLFARWALPYYEDHGWQLPAFPDLGGSAQLQRFGAEMAVSISGDDIKTITRYYADPSQPNIGDLRVS